MVPRKTLATSAGLTESLSPLEFDTESESFRATYDSGSDSTSLALIAVVATALDREPQNLTPLRSVIELEALDKLMGSTNCDRISFEYHGFELTVTNEGVIKANPSPK